jgi:hypothetical protein
VLQEAYLPRGHQIPKDSARLYAPRCSINSSNDKDIKKTSPSIGFGKHPAVLRINKRITAPDWYQDVRHLEFETKEDIG